MDNNEKVKVIVSGQKIQVPSKFAQVSEYMRGLQALGFQDQQQIVIDSIQKETLLQILQFYTLCNYEQVFIKIPIKTNNIHDIMAANICEFVQKHSIDSQQFKNLIKACQFLGCKNLMRVCAARCACFIYFQDSKQAFQNKQKELKIKINVQFEDNQKFKKLYPFMNN